MVIKAKSLTKKQTHLLRSLFVDGLVDGEQGTMTPLYLIETGRLSEKEWNSLYETGLVEVNEDGFVRITTQGTIWWRKNNGS